MKIPWKLIIPGVLLGLIAIVLGIVGLATNSWVNIKSTNATVPFATTYGLFRCSSQSCSGKSGFSTVQGLEIAGVVAIGVGVILAVLLYILTKKRWIRLLSQILLFGGPTLILIGLLLYAKYVFEDISKGPSGIPVIVGLGYSLILITVACLLGFLTAIYFAFAAAFRRHHDHVIHQQPNTPVVIVDQRSERF